MNIDEETITQGDFELFLGNGKVKAVTLHLENGVELRCSVESFNNILKSTQKKEDRRCF